jgi:hypothetical protein
MRLTRPSIALAAAFACLLPAGATAITLGSTQAPTAFSALRCDQPRFGTGYAYYQAVTLPGLPSSMAPSSGAISSWRTDQFGAGDPGGTIALVILHPTLTGVSVSAIDMQRLPAVIPRGDITFTPSTPVPIGAGDFIGIWGPDDSAGCFFSGGERTEAFAYAAVGPPLTVGGPYGVRQQGFNRVDVAAELGAAPAGPTPPAPPTSPHPPSVPTGPSTPTFGPDGRPLVGGSGRVVTVDTGQRVGCSEAGPCTVITAAVTYFPTGGQVIAAAAARRHGRARARRAKPVLVGRRRFTIPAGGRAKVVFPLNRAGKSGLRRFGRLRLVVTTTVTQGTARPAVARRRFTIRAPSSAHRRARR